MIHLRRLKHYRLTFFFRIGTMTRWTKWTSHVEARTKDEAKRKAGQQLTEHTESLREGRSITIYRVELIREK